MPLDVGKFAPVTLGHMRSQGCRELLAYCNSGRCNHSTAMNIAHLPDNIPIKSLADSIVCTDCGHVGADVIPNWRAHYGILNAEFHKLSLAAGPWGVRPERPQYAASSATSMVGVDRRDSAPMMPRLILNLPMGAEPRPAPASGSGRRSSPACADTWRQGQSLSFAPKIPLPAICI